MSTPFSNKKTIALLVALLVCMFFAPFTAQGARTDEVWEEEQGSYLKTIWDTGRNILINGSNKYLNFGTVSGSSGYGIRDNAGTIECKNSGGSWGSCGTGGGGGGGDSTLITWNSGTNVISTDGASTTATTTLSSYTYTATSLVGPSTFPYASTTGLSWTTASGTSLNVVNATSTTQRVTTLAIGSDAVTDITGTGLTVTGGALTLVTSGDWTGTFDGIEGSAYLSRANHTGTQATSTITGIFGIANGGTGTSTTPAQDMFLVGNGTGFDYRRIVAGSNVTVSTTTAGQIVIASTASGGSGTDVNWSYTGGNAFISPATSTNGIIVRASSTIGGGTQATGLTIDGGATTTGSTNLGGLSSTLVAGITSAPLFVNASTTGRAGVVMTNRGNGTEPEMRFAIHDPDNVAEYIAFGLSAADSVSPVSLYGLNKNDFVYVLSNSGRDGLFAVTGQDLYLGAGNSALPAVFQIDGTTNRVIIGAATNTTPTSLLTVVGDITTSNIYATGTASSTNASTTNMSIYGRLFDRTSSAGTNGMVLQTNGSGITWVATSTLGLGGAGGGTVTSVDMTVPTGLSISGNPITTSGTLALTYTAGYAGVLTASTSNWNTFYDTPSSRITAGTGVDWSGSTINGVYTAGDGITLNTEDFDCDTASGSVFGCLLSADWTTFNNKVSSSSIDVSAELAALITDETGSAGSIVFSGNPLFAGFRSNASSTIGDGTATGGLTVSGSATTTGTSTASTMIVKPIGSSATATGTLYIYTGAASKGGEFILEDTDGAGCTGVSALNGVLTATIVACPTEQ